METSILVVWHVCWATVGWILGRRDGIEPVQVPAQTWGCRRRYGRGRASGRGSRRRRRRRHRRRRRCGARWVFGWLGRQRAPRQVSTGRFTAPGHHTATRGMRGEAGVRKGHSIDYGVPTLFANGSQSPGLCPECRRGPRRRSFCLSLLSKLQAKRPSLLSSLSSLSPSPRLASLHPLLSLQIDT